MNLIIGAGGQGRVVYDILNSLNYNNIIFCDDGIIDNCLNLKVFKSNDIKFNKITSAIIAIGDNMIRKNIATKYDLNYINAIDPRALISSINVILGKGIAIMPGSIINLNVKIGNHSIINSGSIIEHDCIIEDYVHISPGAILCGGVRVGEGTQIGAGVKIIPNKKIGNWCMIGAGAVVTKDIPDYSLVVGVPGKIIKSLKNE